MKYKKGQFRKGHKSFNKKGEYSSSWKGDKVGYYGLHLWIRRCKQKPVFCESCKLKPPKDLANISQKYKRDVNDFEWLCRSCHMKKDGRMEIFLKSNVGHIPWNKGLTKSNHKSIRKSSKKMLGKLNPNWRGGTKKHVKVNI